MSRTTHARARALNIAMAPVPENPVASERRRADALANLTNNRANISQGDSYRGFTSRRNSAPSSTPIRPPAEPTSASASRPLQGTSDADSRLSATERLRRLLRDNENPFAGREPDAPAGGPPGDEGPGDDPGDDPNDPDFYDDDLDDLPPDVDPTLVVLNNLAGAVGLLARSSRRANESSSRTRVREPDTFDGTDAKKLRAFLVQCELNFQDCPRAFNEDRAKVTFAQSYLKGMALEWFEPNLLGDVAPDQRPLWMDNWREFLAELSGQFGPHDPVGDAEHQLDNLRMKETHRIVRYLIEFNCLGSQLRGYGEAALRHKFYTGLPDRIKDEICRTGKPRNLEDLRALAQDIDARYWERKDEIARQTKNNPVTSSNTTGNTSNRKATSSSNSSQPSASSSSSGSKPAGRVPDISDKLGRDGKLTSEEHQRRFDKGLCMFCGASGHLAKECPKAGSRAAKACAAVAETLVATPTVSSEAKN